VELGIPDQASKEGNLYSILGCLHSVARVTPKIFEGIPDQASKKGNLYSILGRLHSVARVTRKFLNWVGS